MWDGKAFSNYRAKRNNKKGIIVFDGDSDHYQANSLRYKSSVAPLMGYYLNTIKRVDTVLREAREISLRAEREPVNDVNCHVIDAKTKYGDYTVWIDPEHGYSIARAEVSSRRDENHFYGSSLTQRDVSFRVTILRFERIDCVWISVDGVWEMTRVLPKGTLTGGTTRVTITDIVLNPDHEALGSFVRDDVGDGTWGWIAPHHQIKYTWQAGEFVPQFDEEVVASIDKTVRAVLAERQADSGKVPPALTQVSVSAPLQEPNEAPVAEDQEGTRPEKRKPPHPHCGLYCIYTMIGLADRQAEFGDLIKPEYLGHAEGSSFLELRQAARDYGLYAEPIARLTTRGLKDCPYGAILHVRAHPASPKYDHYELFLGSEKGKAKLYNPPEAPRLVPFAELAPRWSGHALFVSSRPLDLSLLAAKDRQRWLLYAMIGVVVVLVSHAGKRLWLAIVGELPRRWSVGLSVGQVGVLGLGAMLCAGFYHFAHDEGLLANATATQALQKGHAVDFIPKVSEKKVGKLLETETLFVDARLTRDYEAGHLDGAISLPIDANDAVWDATMAKIPRRARIVAYCQSAGCKFAEQTSLRLAEEGYSDVSIFKGGWAEWVAKHGRPERPTSRGKEVNTEDAEQNDSI